MNVKYLGIFILLIFVLSLNSISAADSGDVPGESAQITVGENVLSSAVPDDDSQQLHEEPLKASEGDNELLEANDDSVSLSDVNSGNENSISDDLSIQVISNNPTAKVGDRISFDLIIKNIGNIDLTGVYILDLLHDGMTFDSYAGDKWNRVADKFEFDETLKVGQTEVLTVFFIADETGTLKFIATVGAIYADNDRAFNTTKILDDTNEDKHSINGTGHIVASYGESDSVSADNLNRTDVSKYATGNPILLSLLSLMFLPIRRFL